MQGIYLGNRSGETEEKRVNNMPPLRNRYIRNRFSLFCLISIAVINVPLRKLGLLAANNKLDENY